ncbi:MAG TPA: hypothetical protein DIT96_00145 [Pseudomonas sp.]|nr:hypothetical protein [Pseudomonas sp.]
MNPDTPLQLLGGITAREFMRDYWQKKPLLVRQARFILREQDPAAMPPMLERTVKGTLLTNLLFVVGIVLSKTLL